MKFLLSLLVYLCACFNLSSQNKTPCKYRYIPFFKEKINPPISSREAIIKEIANKYKHNPFLSQLTPNPVLENTNNILSIVDYRTLQNHKNFHLLPSRRNCGLQEKFLNTRRYSNEAAIKEFPWMVLLEYSVGYYSIGFACGGSLINDRYVLTAAHCVRTRNNQKLFRVRLGEHDFYKKIDCDKNYQCNDPPLDVRIEKFLYHKDYNSNKLTHDIALLRLDRKIKMTPFIKPICLPLNDERSKAERPLFIAGWGRRDASGPISNGKIKAKVAPIPDRFCRQYWLKRSLVVLATQFCAGGQSSTSTCQGDSGGPIMSTFHNTKQWYAEGIVSYGLSKCGRPPAPTVFTRVSYYIKWILDNIEE